ncbi:hypothetical protein DE146DRAFT_329907 [Phaeosphaeria sp. MPI-PUGE-AT-0046c]|nr:hypothetical protein DE146DRAFT_329907 [Phaeosphaeria sp. MPI-PUGE-AT-0046c]
MHHSIAFVSMLASATMAADVIPFYFPAGSEGVDPVATINKVASATTEFKVACPTNIDAGECGWGPGLDYTIISNTIYQAQLSYGTVSMSYSCDHNTKASEMTCAVSMTGGNLDLPSPQTATFRGSELVFNTATIVQGANLLSGGAAQATPAAAAGSGSASANPLATGSGAMASHSPSKSGSAAPAEHTGSATKFGVQAPALFALLGALVMSAL